MFCLFAVLIYLCVLVCKKGLLCSSWIERKGYCTSVTVFLYFNSNVCKSLTKKLPMGKKIKIEKKSCQIALFSSKTATESLKPSTVFCFDLSSCVNLSLYKLVCK